MVRGQSSRDQQAQGSMDGLVRPGQPSPLQEKFESPVDVHTVAHPGHAQIDIVLLGQGGKMGAVDLVVQEPGSVLSQAQPLQPIRHIELGPEPQRFSAKGLVRGQRKQASR